MELKEALKEINKNYGSDIIKDPKIINILSDYKTFDNLICSKFIIKTLISEGYINLLLKVQGNDKEFEKFKDKFLYETGLDYNKSMKVLQEICEGWDLNITFIKQNTQNLNSEQKKKSVKNIYSLDKDTWNYRPDDSTISSFWDRFSENLPHNDFKGIPIDGKAVSFLKQLSGEDSINKTGKYLVYKTSFAGIDNCEIVILESEYSGKVYAVYVLTPKKRIFDDIDNEFKSLKEALTKKYTEPLDHNFCWYEGDNLQTALRRNLLEQKSYFFFQNGTLVLQMDSTERNLLAYFDRDNYKEHSRLKENKLSQAQNDDL